MSGPVHELGGVLREYVPVSWFHPRGIFRVRARLEPRLPDVSGRLFLTFTINPTLFADPQKAFDHARTRLRKVFFRLRRGVCWEGRIYTIDAPYGIKVEFHRNGWAHFHVVFLTRAYLPGGLLNHLWDLGRTNVRRIDNRTFQYLLKYVTKGGGLPEWVLGRSRLRIFQSSRGFLSGTCGDRKLSGNTSEAKAPRPHSTIGSRIEKWRRTALFEQSGRYRQFTLLAPFFELLAELVYPIALAGRYLGGGRTTIGDVGDLIGWIA